MASRTVFFVDKENLLYKDVDVIFEWFPGFAKIQKQKSIASLHENYTEIFPKYKILEVSSYSKDDLGVSLSAFNLSLKTKNGVTISVEQAFQSSKVFKYSGTQEEAIMLPPREIKKYIGEIHKKDTLVEFNCFGNVFPLNPKTFFYNWLYINTLNKNTILQKELTKYDAFTDIAFSKNKSINSQAEACSIFVSLVRRNLLNEALSSKESFLRIVYGTSLENSEKNNIQTSLF